MRIGRAEKRRMMATATLGLAAVVWAVVQAAQGDWGFYGLAVALTIATNLTVARVTQPRLLQEDKIAARFDPHRR